MWEVRVIGFAVNAATTGLNLTQNQFDALVDFAYNEGVFALYNSTLLKVIRGQSTVALEDAFTMWDKDHENGKLVVNTDLYNRRVKEYNLYVS
jgi:GH24 family phage-related lysozyme (muramidase)